MFPMIIFDDALGQLGPMTDLRAAFEVRTGMYTTAARIGLQFPRWLVGYWTPQRLSDLVADRANAPVNVVPGDEVIWCVNGRWAMPDAQVMPPVGHALIEQPTGHVIAALLRRADAEYFLSTGQLHERVRRDEVAERVLYRYPWDILAMMKQTIVHDISSTRMLDDRVLNRDVVTVGGGALEIHATAKVMPGVVFDLEAGPVMVHEHATIRPGAVVCGPCSIGEHATVLDRAIIKANTVIGPWCKVGGEVGATIFQGYANKSHDGHLGDSWVGKWVNLGAGTTNSNLLNTYGEVSMRIEADGPRHRTGMNFLGAIVGDHVKTAICTRLMTGSVLGTGAMIACSAPPPTNVRRFAWLTDEGERTYTLEKFIETMQAVMARRDEMPGEAYLNAVRELHQRWARGGS